MRFKRYTKTIDVINVFNDLLLPLFYVLKRFFKFLNVFDVEHIKSNAFYSTF